MPKKIRRIAANSPPESPPGHPKMISLQKPPRIISTVSPREGGRRREERREGREYIACREGGGDFIERL